MNHQHQHDGFDAADGVRLQKVLARLGYGSRRSVEELIRDRKVVVNGEIAELGRRIDPETDRVEVDGVLIGVTPGLVYYLLHKPAGVVTTMSDTHNREIVTELVPDEPRVFPVGRLDLETEGLLLLTNDGDLTHRLTHPSYGVEKQYFVQLDKDISRGHLRQLREGIELEDGLTAPAKAAAIETNIIRLTISEGRNRQVRRMCAALGYLVTRLVRIRIGPLTDRTLKARQWRELTQEEVHALAKAAS